MPMRNTGTQIETIEIGAGNISERREAIAVSPKYFLRAYYKMRGCLPSCSPMLEAISKC